MRHNENGKDHVEGIPLQVTWDCGSLSHFSQAILLMLQWQQVFFLFCFVFKPRPYHEFRDSEMTVFPSHQPLLPGAPWPSQSCERAVYMYGDGGFLPRLLALVYPPLTCTSALLALDPA